jgi:hypothetical protein
MVSGRFPMSEVIGLEAERELKRYPVAEMAEISRYAISSATMTREMEK